MANETGTSGTRSSGSELAMDMEILKDDVREARNDFQKIGEDVSSIMRDAVGEGKRLISEQGKRIGERSGQVAVSASQRFDELKVATNNTYQALLTDLSARVETRPVTSIVTAFFAGIVCGKLFSRS